MFCIGDIVLSNAGHDVGRFYIVLRLDGEFAYVCDGRYRSVDNPKRKRIKHLRYAFSKAINDGINVELDKNLTDADIKSIIKKWREYAERR